MYSHLRYARLGTLLWARTEAGVAPHGGRRRFAELRTPTWNVITIHFHFAENLFPEDPGKQAGCERH